jgi:hypothetical protein
MPYMLSTFITAVVPLLSVLLGAFLTYWINVRIRRSNRIEDLFDEAIAATAVADASQNYLAGMGRPDGLSEQEYWQVVTSLARGGIENHVKRTSEAREAIARVAQYEPLVRPCYQDAVIKGDRPQEIIRLLAEAKSRYVKTSRTNH